MTRLDPAEPAVRPDDIAAAMHRIRPTVRETPVIEIRAGQLGLAIPVTLKLELLQHAGSFKTRGAFNRVLAAEEAGEVGAAGLIAASGGNHGAAVAYVGRQLGRAAEIFMPSTSPAVKRARIESFGATVHVIEGYFDDANRACVQRQAETGALFVHPFEHPDIIAGQGTMSVELDDQVGEYDTLLAAAGGGGFIAGQAAWVRDTRRVVGVEPSSSCCMHAALANRAPVPVDVSGIAADSLGCIQLGATAWTIIQHHVDASVLVSDEAIQAAQRSLWDELRLVVEPGGAAALAALQTGAYVPEAGERVVVAVCGSNCDPATVQ